jgi:hypothetical protein
MTKIVLLDIVNIKHEPKEIARKKLTGMQKLALSGLEGILPIEVEVKIIKEPSPQFEYQTITKPPMENIHPKQNKGRMP